MAMDPLLTTILYSIFQIIYNPEHISEDTLRPVPYAAEEFEFADTTVGRVRGVRQLSRGSQFYTHFRGIPYAKPPVGDLRFEPPVPHPGWEGTLNATKYKLDCPQINSISRGYNIYGREDCLFINVATRKTYFKTELPKKEFRPVIVWIHGGHFMLGSSHAYSPRYWMEEDIVFVTFNYRLGVLGFLNTGEGTVAGNMGLKDQVLALKWVRDNIKYFNGDPLRVYILGESAGAVAVHMHTLSPLSRDLFAGAVSMGGTALSPWGLISNPADQAVKLAKTLKCETKNKEKMLQCLKDLPMEAIVNYQKNYFGKELVGKRTYFGPTIETVEFESEPAFLPQHPLDLLKDEVIANVPWINGVNSGDGASVLISIMKDEFLQDRVNTEWNMFAPVFMFYQNHSKSNTLSRQIRKDYLRNRLISVETVKDATNMFSDKVFFYDSHKATLLHSRKAPVYSYYYDYEGVYSFSALASGLAEENLLTSVMSQAVSIFGALGGGNVQPTSTRSVCHGDELPLMFSMPLVRNDIEMLDDDYEFSRKLIRLWVSFAKTGIPEVGESVKWKPLNQTNKNQEDVAIKRLVLNKAFATVKEPFFERLQIFEEFNVMDELYTQQTKDL